MYNNNSDPSPSELKEEDKDTTAKMKLQMVGLIDSVISLTFLVIAVVTSIYKGWLQPFQRGLLGGVAFIDNFSAFQLLITTAVPLSFGELLSHAEWTILTALASFIGPAEVAAWAILGNIWDLFFITFLRGLVKRQKYGSLYIWVIIIPHWPNYQRTNP